MRIWILTGILFAFCPFVFAADAMIVPASTSSADIDLPLTRRLVKAARKFKRSRWWTRRVQEIHPQPRITFKAENDSLKAHFEGDDFLGRDAPYTTNYDPESIKLPVLSRSRPSDRRQYSNPCQRSLSNPAHVWLYNLGTAPLELYWRLVSGSDELRGDKHGTDCDKPENWQRLTIATGLVATRWNFARHRDGSIPSTRKYASVTLGLNCASGRRPTIQCAG